MSIGMQCKARRVLRSLAARASRNAAMRWIRILPEGLGHADRHAGLRGNAPA
jgi:hypothetical protein